MKVLLIRLREIGDVVFTTPAVRAVRQRFPTAHISYLVEPAAAPVVEGNPHIDDVIVAPRRRGATGLANEIALARRIRRERFDLVIDFHGGPRASILAWLSGAPERIGYEVVGRAWMYTTRVARARELRRRHSVENQWDLLASLGIAAPSPETSPVEMAVDQATSARVGKRLTDAGIGSGDELIVIHVSAGNPFRRWPLASFASVAARLAAADPARRVVVTSGPSEGDAADLVIQQARAAMPPAARPRLVASGDFRSGSFALSSIVRRYSSAATAGQPTSPPRAPCPSSRCTGPTLPERSAPWRSPAVPALAIDTSGLPCRPCSQRVCEPGDFRCLTRIAPERVVDAAEHVLGTKQGG